jgi:hypothetical protein
MRALVKWIIILTILPMIIIAGLIKMLMDMMTGDYREY